MLNVSEVSRRADVQHLGRAHTTVGRPTISDYIALCMFLHCVKLPIA